MIQRIWVTFLTICLVLTLFCSPAPVHAQTSSAYDLINAVNDFRASYGLAPYQIDDGLMAKAQEHSDYQASIQTRTHLRADGSGPGDHGITSENIGSGENVSAHDLIYLQWTDYWHTFTLIGYTTGLVGAGVAVVDGCAYYTLVMVNTGKKTGLPGSASATPGSEDPVSGATSAPGITSAPVNSTPASPINPLFTSTPHEDGSVYHPVAAKQTLWDIAILYGMSVDSLVALNGLSATNPVIYAGDDLLVKPANTVTPTPTITLTPTKTLRPTRTPHNLDITLTPAAPESVESATPPLVSVSQQSSLSFGSAGLLIAGICLVGLAGVLISKFWLRK